MGLDFTQRPVCHWQYDFAHDEALFGTPSRRTRDAAYPGRARPSHYTPPTL